MNDIHFALPDVGEGLAEALISRWFVAEGEPVARMDPMVEIETAKSAVEIPSPVDGIMVRHGAAAGDSLSVGSLLAVLESNDRPAGGETPVTAVDTAQRHPGERRVRAAPTVRRRAHQAGVDLAAVTASGPGDRVLMSDLEAHLGAGELGPAQATLQDSVTAAATSTPAAEAPSATRVPHRSAAHRGGGIQPARSERLGSMRSAIFDTMTRAWASVPLITDIREVDATQLRDARAALREESGADRLTYTTLFCHIVIAALRRHPELNVLLDADARTLNYQEHVDLGVAVSVPGGLSVGVVRQAEQLSLGELADAIGSVSSRARDGQLSGADMTGATITVTSFGTHGGWFGTPLVIPPQVLIVGFGGIKDTVVPVDGVPAVRPTLPMSVSADHRVVDGAELSVFCSTVERFVTEPVRMVAI